MYNSYFGLKESPFSIAPDPRFLYMSENHREALSHLLYGIQTNGGFVLLTGEVGAGKTTVCRSFFSQLPESTDLAFILNPMLSAEELLASVCDELGAHVPLELRTIKTLVDRIHSVLLETHARGRKTVLVIEEAQNLSITVLEHIRLLTNLETDREKLLQVIMLGQPELRDLLSRPDLKQLSQRITARYHLGALSRSEVGSYVAHRLSVAGCTSPLFSAAALGELAGLSGGIPRIINLLCDRALLGAYGLGRTEINRPLIVQAAREVFGVSQPGRTHTRLPRFVLAAALILAFATTALLVTHARRESVEAKAKETYSDRVQRTGRNPDASRQAAMEALFTEWGLKYLPSEEACAQARKAGLDCFEGQGNMGRLQRLNRPAVLTFVDQQGSPYYETLSSLRGITAAFRSVSAVREVETVELEKGWTGKFFLLWRRPPEVKREIRPGDRGEAVAWLSRHMAVVNGRTAEGAVQVRYGEPLISEVKAFQKRNGITADGIAGTQTLIHLSALAGSSDPKLIAKEKP